MAKYLSEDLRIRVIRAVDGGMSRNAAARRFGVSIASAVRWMAAYLRGIREFNAAFEQGQNRAEVVRLLTERTPVKEPALYDQMVMPRLHPDGYLNLRSVQADVAWYVERDLVKDPPRLRDLVDYRYLEYAHGRLGRLGPPMRVEE